MQITTPFPALVDEANHLYEYRVNPRFSFSIDHKYRLITALLPCITGIGSIYQAVATARDMHKHPAPGRMEVIDDCRLHVRTAGRGLPAVVLEAGLGGMSSAWGWIQKETAKFSCVISYDRAGLGWSGPDTSPKSAVLAAQRLHKLLLSSQVPPPYILAGCLPISILTMLPEWCYLMPHTPINTCEVQPSTRICPPVFACLKQYPFLLDWDTFASSDSSVPGLKVYLLGRLRNRQHFSLPTLTSKQPVRSHLLGRRSVQKFAEQRGWGKHL